MGQETDPSLIGVTLDGRYRIIEPVGDGSAGAVYRAKQLNVDRDVAVKVLDPRTLPAEGLPDAISRFENEARIVSKLRHPHTIKLLDFGRMPDGRLYFVMEFLHGEPLNQLLEQGPLDEQRTLRIIRQVAESLTEAHEQGIIHRDLKPGNIFVDRVGKQEEVKVIDFGIAKVTAQPFKTATGMVFGTPAYMSPEQAQGLELDARSDLYSLGVVAYHCLTGRLPFESDTPVGLLVKHVSEPPPPFSSLAPPVKVSPGLERLILRLLAKRPEDRPASAIEVRDAAVALEHPSGAIPVPDFLATTRIQVARKKRLRLLQWIAAWAVVLVAAVVAIIQLKDRIKESDHQPPTAAVGEPPSGAKPVTATLKQLTDTPEIEDQATISPDGTFVAYVSENGGKGDIYLLRVGGERPINLTADAKADNYFPAFSPDGAQIAFVSKRDGPPGLYLMGATGESVRHIADQAFNPAWMPDGKAIVCATEAVWNPASRQSTSSLYLLDLSSGQKRKIFDGDAVQPSVSPHGHRIAYWANKNGQRDIWTIGMDGKNPVPVTQDPETDFNPVWAPDGKSLFFLSDRGGVRNLWRVPIDDDSGRVLGQLQSVTAGAAPMSGLTFSHTGLGVSSLSSGTETIKTQVFDPIAETMVGEPTEVFTSTRGFYAIDLSADGKLLVGQTLGVGEDLAVIATDGTGRLMLTNDIYKDRHPRFSPDGSQIVFYSNRSGRYEAWLIKPDGTSLRQATDTNMEVTFPTWTLDGRGLLISDNVQHALLRFDIQTELPKSNAQPVTDPIAWNGKFLPFWISPDGKRLSGIHSEEGLENIWGRLAILSLDQHTIDEIEVEGLGQPRWLPDSRRIMFLEGRKIVLIDTESKRKKTLREVLPGSGFSGLALSKDGKLVYYVEVKASADLWLLTLKE